MSGRETTRSHRHAIVLAAFAFAAAVGAAGLAWAETPAEATPEVSAASGGGTGGSPDSTAVVLRSESVWPTRVFFSGTRKASYRFEIGGARARGLRIEAVNRDLHEVVRRWSREDVKPRAEERVRWNGTLRNGSAAPKGDYLFRIRDSEGELADRTRSKRRGRRAFGLFPYKFPVRGPHSYGDGVGAARAGHRHQGQDVSAGCGTKLVAARGGRVQHNANQPGGAGNYLVIDGRNTSHDFVYMHLRRRSALRRGAKVKTGQKIGRVGATGDATGCHLHFEEWSGPGWYEGGHFMRSVTRHLRRWDAWS